MNILCKICGKNETSGKNRKICGICYNKKHIIKCSLCDKSYDVTANYFIRLDLERHKCKQCKLIGSGNPNFGNKWSEDRKKKFSEFIKSKVDDEYRKNCSKAMKDKKVSEKTKAKRKETMIEKYGKLINSKPMTEETKKKIGEKSKLKFTSEYLKRIRKINEERGVWIPLNKKKEYIIYRDLSNWKFQVITEHTVGIDKLKEKKLYNKENRNKDSLVRDHMFGRKNGFNNGVFPEIIRHPANCQLISHLENLKKSKSKNDSIINLDELFEKIKNWKINYEEQEICINFVKRYENGERFDIKKYLNNL